MFNIKEFNHTNDLLKNNEIGQANTVLKKLRKNYFIHPGYLFLMSLFLLKSNRTYLAIDTLLLSLKVDNTAEILKKYGYENSSKSLIEERYLLLISLFKKIKNLVIVNMLETSMKKKDPTHFLLHLEKIMPGIRLKNKL
tara:strand:- start:32 stop:448 length:417 start_codon:yes stop_codon:yes gene_type:complete